MMISTKGRYALRVMVDLAEHSNDGYVALKEIAERQNISKKYLEAIMALLSKAELVDAVHGKGGGYRLNNPPEHYRIGDILRITEDTLAPVACLEKSAEPCPRESKCSTVKMWRKLYTLIDEFFDGITVADLMNTEE